MNRHARTWSARLICVLLLAASGCGAGRTAVEVVSVEESGVEITEVQARLDPVTDWPAWRGINGNGIAQAQSAPTVWSEQENVRWIVDVPGRGHGSPTVVDDLVLLATADDQAQKQMLLAFDRATGEPRWEQTIHEGNFPSKREIHRKSTNANSTVACDGEHCFIAFFNNGKVTASALDLDGEIAWQQELGGFVSRFGFAPSPILYKSLVIFAVDNAGGGYIAACDAKTGEIAWRVKRPAMNSHSSPIVATVGGKDQLLISGCELVASYDPNTGKENWSTKGTSQTTCGTMVVSGDRVFAAGGYPDREVVCLSASGKRLWDQREKIYEPSMIAVGENIFAVSDNGIAYCWSAQDGNELWKKRLGGQFSGSPTLCGNNLYVSDLSGKTYVFQASGEGYTEVAVNQLGSDSYACPTIVEGEIYLRVGVSTKDSRQERLACIASAAGE